MRYGRFLAPFAAACVCAAAFQGTRAEVEPAADPLAGALGALLARSGADVERIGVAVIDEQGRERALLEADAPLKPASNMKLLTTAAGLVRLGPGHEFVTRILAYGGVENGTVRGDLVVVGTGDPTISGRFHGGDPEALFRTWARRLRAAGIAKVEGDLVGDDTYFDSVRFLPGWNPADAGRAFSAEVSSLSFNDNCVAVRVTPGEPGAVALVSWAPQNGSIDVTGAPQTVAGRVSEVLIRRESGGRITVGGRIGSRVENWVDHVAVEDPALFFVHTLGRILREEGIRILGRVLRVSAAEAVERGSGSDRPAGVALVEHRTELRVDIPVINKESQNLHAELLLKALGRKLEGEGSAAAGARVVARFLEERGIPTAGLVMLDGSGLSHGNRTTARQIAAMLHSLRREEAFREFLGSLPASGVDGTLERRFRRHPGLVGRVRAKTGSIRGVSSLSGYIEQQGITWSFSILVNSLPRGSASAARRLQEEILARIDEAMARDA